MLFPHVGWLRAEQLVEGARVAAGQRTLVAATGRVRSWGAGANARLALHWRVARGRVAIGPVLVASYTGSPNAKVDLSFPRRPIDSQIRADLQADSARPATGSAHWVALLLGADATAWNELLGLSLIAGLNHSYWDVSSDLPFALSSKHTSLALEGTLRCRIFERDQLSVHVGGGAQAKVTVSSPWVDSSGAFVHGFLGFAYDFAKRSQP